ncbi:Cyclic AMP-GMP synthase [compost metagenome]
MLNLSQLFFTSDADETALLDHLDLDATQKTEIQNAKGLVRAALREGIPKKYAELGLPGKAPQPRFFTQGSWAYKTLNAPCQPPQEADIDDGCYLPMTFVTQQTKRPSVAAEAFFRIAEDALAPLVKAKSWRFGGVKPTCIRIHISTSAHIDVPLYAIPDDEFEKLKKSMALEARAMDSATLNDSIDRWDTLPLDQVLLAHRDENWMPSDPRPLNDWFIDQVEVQGRQLRRVIRYLKAFRDHQWKSGGPASVLLMAAAVPLFQQEIGRDDLSLLNVAKGIPRALRTGVSHPTDESESLTDRLRKAGLAEGRDLVEEAAMKFDQFASVLEATLAASDAVQGVIWMRGQFGHRFPNRPDRVKISVAATSVAATTATAGVASVIASTPAKAGPTPLVGPTHAG